MADVVYQTNPPVPTGTIMMYSVNIAPSGYLLCDGRAVSRSSFHSLFSIIQTTFGNGNGTTTFNVPDMRDRFPMGAGNNYTLNQSGGANSYTINATHLPPHVHKGTTDPSGPSASTGNNGINVAGSYNVGLGGTHTHTFTTNTSNGTYENDATTLVPNNPFTVLNQYLSVYYIIKY